MIDCIFKKQIRKKHTHRVMTTDKVFPDCRPSPGVGVDLFYNRIILNIKAFTMDTHTDTQLHELAHKRVEFRAHLIVYLVVNGALWLIWFVTGSGYMWPVWPMAGWGIGLLLHYLFEYRFSSLLSEEEEFKRLKKQEERNEKER